MFVSLMFCACISTNMVVASSERRARSCSISEARTLLRLISDVDLKDLGAEVYDGMIFMATSFT